MAFDLKKFIDDIFEPTKEEVFTMLIDIPHGNIVDNIDWKNRREMAKDWLKKMKKFAPNWEMIINPLVTYKPKGSNNADLPKTCLVESKEDSLKSIIEKSTIIISMAEFSATAPLYEYSLNQNKLRIASMPGAGKFMEETGLSADYKKISKKCKHILKIFKKAKGALVKFSTGNRCYFDLRSNEPFIDDGILHPQRGGTASSLSNLPAGEVYCVPDEGKESQTRGELPFKYKNSTGVYVVESNRIVDVKGSGPGIENIRQSFKDEKAQQNIAEFAIGVNDKATVTGNVLQDEKAGFHWAYGRSDHLGGTVGVDDFSSPERVVHIDIVYAKGNPIICSEIEMFFNDNSKETILKDGNLLI